MKWIQFKLKELLDLSDSGTWGPEADAHTGSPVIRSTNIQENELLLNEVAWRKIPTNHRQTKRLENGDIIVTTSSGSPAHIGKTCVFRQPNDGRTYYFSNFTLRLRPNPKLLDTRLLQYWLSSSRGRAILQAMNNTTSGLRNLNRNLYLDQKTPLPVKPDGTPDLSEQRRIAAILDKADEVRRKRQEAIRLTEELLRSAFLDMFGDPVTNPKGWKTVRVERLCRVVRGSSPRPKGDPRYYGGPVPRLMVADLTRDGWFVTPRIDNLTEKGAKLSRPVPKGTIVMVVSGNVGIVAQLEEDACIHDGFVGFPDLDYQQVTPLFFMLSLHFLKTTHERQKSGAIWKNITTSDIKKMLIPVPPIDMQEKVDLLFQQYRVLHERVYETVKTTNDLFNSVVQRAFKGEL